jgi:hypothetical protein
MVADESDDTQASVLAGGDAGDDLDPEIPPLPPSLIARRVDSFHRRSRLPSLRSMLASGVAVVVVGGFAAAVWWSYRQSSEETLPENVPLIVAEAEPEKVAPAEEGGAEVPFQGSASYQAMVPGTNEPEGEQLLPPPETPYPVTEPVTEPGAESADTASPEPSPATPGALLESGTDQIEPPPPQPFATEESTATATDQEESAAAPATEEGPPAIEAEPTGFAPAEKPQVAAGAQASSVAEASSSETVEVPAATPASGVYVQLASVQEEGAANQEAKRIQRKFADLLQGLDVFLVKADLGTQGVYYRLNAGPLPDRAGAKALCAKLKNLRQDCIVAR